MKKKSDTEFEKNGKGEQSSLEQKSQNLDGTATLDTELSVRAEKIIRDKAASNNMLCYKDSKVNRANWKKTRPRNDKQENDKNNADP